MNPAFEAAFERTALGVPLAELFEGGAREAVLRAVVSACDKGESVRFRMREGDVGYSAVVMIWGVRLLMIGLGQTSPAMQLNMGLVYLVIPVAGGLMVLEAILATLGRMKPSGGP